MWRRPRPGGGPTTRLVLSHKMRTNMVDGLRTWRDAPVEPGGGHRKGAPRRVGGAIGAVGSGSCGIRVRGAPQRICRRHRSVAIGQHSGVPDRIGGAGHRPGDRGTCTGSGPGRDRASRRSGGPGGQPYPCGRLGVIFPAQPLIGRRSGGRATRWANWARWPARAASR